MTVGHIDLVSGTRVFRSLAVTTVQTSPRPAVTDWLLFILRQFACILSLSICHLSKRSRQHAVCCNRPHVSTFSEVVGRMVECKIVLSKIAIECNFSIAKLNHESIYFILHGSERMYVLLYMHITCCTKQVISILILRSVVRPPTLRCSSDCTACFNASSLQWPPSPVRSPLRPRS